MSQSHAEIAAEIVARPFAEQNLVSLQVAQVHATLALVEQQARITDLLQGTALEDAWYDGAEQTTEWLANGQSTPGGIPVDPPANPHSRKF